MGREGPTVCQRAALRLSSRCRVRSVHQARRCGDHRTIGYYVAIGRCLHAAIGGCDISSRCRVHGAHKGRRCGEDCAIGHYLYVAIGRCVVEYA